MATSILDIITHYQRSIEKSQDNQERLLHCISKLYRLPVRVEHLQETGVGKTVNSLRKYNGEIGVAAKTLVTKWKAMVAAEEELDECQYEEDNHDAKQPSDDDQDGIASQSNNNTIISTNENSLQKQSRKDDEVSSQEKKKKSSSSSHHKSSSSKHTKTPSYTSSHKHHVKVNDSMTSASHRDRENKRKINESVNDNDVVKGKSDSPQAVHENSNKKNSDFPEKSLTKNTKSSSNEKEKYCNEKDFKLPIKIKQECDIEDNVDAPSSSSNATAHRVKSKKEHRSEKNSSKSTKSSSSNNAKERPSSSHQKRHRSNHESDNNTTSKAKIPKVSENGIDCSMGASFEDALGMCNIPSSSKSSKSTVKTIVKSPTTQKPCSSSKSTNSNNSNHSNIDLLSSSCKLEPLDSSIVLDLPTITTNYKPTPLNQTVMECVFPQKSTPKASIRPLNDYEALDRVMSSKTMRTKIYSGTKPGSVTQVLSLYDLCIRVLQKNIDALEYTGGVPFEILQPILQRATPIQLFAVEEFNPYLIEDTDSLWEQHVIRHYRGKMREEMESWREMFVRCQAEQERKLNFLTENIKISQMQSALPVRKTQLAYVDSIAKAPRGVQRKQELYGTKEKLVATPASRVAALSSVVPNAAKAGDVRLRVAQACAREPVPLANPMRPKKAPLMAKALQQFNKGRFQR